MSLLSKAKMLSRTERAALKDRCERIIHDTAYREEIRQVAVKLGKGLKSHDEVIREAKAIIGALNEVGV